MNTRLAGVGATVLLLCACAASLKLGQSTTPPPTPPGLQVATAAVTRSDLVSHTKVDGTLGYAHSRVVLAEGGRLTWLPEVGTVLRRGKRVLGVDGHAVPLFYGSTPLWRTLQTGVRDGKDVRALERNLAALGYGTTMTVDDHFSWATRQAVKAWQHDMGALQTGAVAVGDLVISPGALRISAVSGVLGDTAHGSVLTATDTKRQVDVNLPINSQELAVRGGRVRIDLPGGKEATGRISWVGTTASAGDSGDEERAQTGQGTETATLPVRITLDRSADAGRLDAAPVTVSFTSAARKGVLAVPVSALQALTESTYAVKVNGRQIPVKLGIFADGLVEVSGPGLSAGMQVEVPRS